MAWMSILPIICLHLRWVAARMAKILLERSNSNISSSNKPILTISWWEPLQTQPLICSTVTRLSYSNQIRQMQIIKYSNNSNSNNSFCSINNHSNSTTCTRNINNSSWCSRRESAATPRLDRSKRRASLVCIQRSPTRNESENDLIIRD